MARPVAPGRALLLAAAAALAGCAPSAVVVVAPGYAVRPARSVALIGFADFPGAAGSGLIVGDSFEKYLALPGYKVIAGQQALGSLLDDVAAGTATPAELSTAAKSLGVDALAMGTLSDYENATDQTVMVDEPQAIQEPVYGDVVVATGGGQGGDRGGKDGGRKGVPPGAARAAATTVIARGTNAGRRADGGQVTVTQGVVGYDTTYVDDVVPEETSTPARVALSVKLIDAATGELLWSVSASATGDDLPAAVEEASSDAMQAVAARLARLKPAASPAAAP
jgi:hypothetical protein